MRFSLRILLSLASVLLVSQAHGNGVTASFPVGGVEFKHNVDIAIAREDLFLSPGEIRVHYVFRSSSKQPQTETIAFPLPRVLADFESTPPGSELLDLDGASGDMRNYLDFGVAVDGRPIIPVLHEFAWLGDKEVSAEILAAGLPLFPRYAQWVKVASQLDPATRKALVVSGLLLEHGNYVDPAWEYQAIYEWEQTFATGDTAVSIHYRPLLGWPGDYGVDEFHTGQRADAACVDDALREKIQALLHTNGAYEVAQLDYITTSARYWSGPIREFNLTVAAPHGAPRSEDDGSPTLAAVCPGVTRMEANGERHWQVGNYVPEQDLHVTFYFFSAPRASPSTD